MARNEKGTKRPRQTDDYRAAAVLMLKAAGYPNRKGALAEVARHLKQHERTLSRWYNQENNPAPDTVVTKKEFNLLDLLSEELAAAFTAAKTERGGASYRDLMTGIGILSDKYLTLTGAVNQRIEISGKGGGPLAVIIRKQIDDTGEG